MDYNINFPNLNIYLEEVGKNVSIGKLSIAFYGIAIAIGMLLAIVLGTTIAKKIGHNPDICYDVAIIAIPAAIATACPSAIPTSKLRCGNFSKKGRKPVPSTIPAETAAMRGSFSPSFTSASPRAREKPPDESGNSPVIASQRAMP